MRKFAVVLMSLMMVFGLAMVAEAGQSNYGCGLGAVVFGPNQDSIVMQTLAITTNGISANGLFGITSGTSECDAPSGIVSNEKVYRFVSANMDMLAKDISVGQGEALDTLAEMLSVPSSDRARVYAQLKSNFSTIYPSSSVDSVVVVDSIVKIIS